MRALIQQKQKEGEAHVTKNHTRPIFATIEEGPGEINKKVSSSQFFFRLHARDHRAKHRGLKKCVLLYCVYCQNKEKKKNRKKEKQKKQKKEKRKNEHRPDPRNRKEISPK